MSRDGAVSTLTIIQTSDDSFGIASRQRGHTMNRFDTNLTSSFSFSSESSFGITAELGLYR